MSKTVPASINKFKSIGLSLFFTIGRCKSKFVETILFPPTYEVLEFLGPTPKESNPLKDLPPKSNLSSFGSSLSCREKILPNLVLTEKIL